MILFSEAIRLGSTFGKQLRGVLMQGDDSCAVGGALKAVGKTFADVLLFYNNPLYSNTGKSIIPEWQWAWREQTTPCPVCGVVDRAVIGGIAHLNDVHYWTRDQIADHVKKYEPLEPTIEVQTQTSSEQKVPVLQS